MSSRKDWEVKVSLHLMNSDKGSGSDSKSNQEPLEKLLIP